MIKEIENGIAKSKAKKDELNKQIEKLNINRKVKEKVLAGKEGKLLSVEQIATTKKFYTEKFRSDFDLLSQFVHVTPFASSLITTNGINLGLLSSIYDKIIPFYIGIITETLELLTPNHNRLEEFQNHYSKFRDGRWGIQKPKKQTT